MASATYRSETVVKVSGVQQSPGLPSLLQGRQHDLGPKGGVEAGDLLNITEQPGGLDLRQQAALLQVQQSTQEQLEKDTSLRLLGSKKNMTLCSRTAGAQHSHQ